MYRAWLAGTGASLPEKVLTNHDLEGMVDTSDEWIVQRTGIRERRIVQEGEVTSDLAIAASRQALEAAGIQPEDLGAVIVGTVTPDKVCPSAAVFVQNALGAVNACAFDLNAACTGFVYSIAVGSSFIQTGLCEHVLVIGAEALSRFVNYSDRNSCILFGDGAGAAVLSRQKDGEDSHIIDSQLFADGGARDLIQIPAGGAALPASPETVEARQHCLSMNGREVFKFATKAMVDLINTSLERNGFKYEDLDIIVPHQVNSRIIDTALKKVDVPKEKIFINLDKYGNTSAASVPIALREAVEEGRIQKGNLVLFVAFGAGMTWGYNLLRW